MNYDFKQINELNLSVYKKIVQNLLHIFDDKIIFKHKMDKEFSIRISNRSSLNMNFKIQLTNDQNIDQYYSFLVNRDNFFTL
jgi:hypothetical protein